MKDIFLFNSMLTPKIITVVYWLMLVGVLVGGIGTMFDKYNGGILAGLGIIVAGAIGARIWCEMMIVLFKIHENLRRIADREAPSQDEL
ncbi:hypothetical protein HMF8227_00335 [Saliniradius amylolyticus]|uniref:DUF4282 domain-containing protein n=1 Tax=Saliniradius amylolyticus TaxID=2183582 RepID=A0A2S2DZM3_9ALTE|nr:DUF4282 domain-containing protein [Saliniradius amylolyticus]AWL10841.1 hypothetical protein HMF8227_00335 [Saliniradius amylolyticus]